MEIVKKPDIRVFASEAKSGEIISFPDVLRGWGVTLDQTQGKPPLEWMNDAFNRIDLNNLYLLQQGIPEWDKAVRYPVNSIIKHADKLYLCIAENENNEPSANSDKWAPYVKNATLAQKGIVKLSSVLSDSETDAATPKVVNEVDKKVKPIAEGGTGATTAAAARTNLGLKSAATLDKTDDFGTSANLVATQLLVYKLQKEFSELTFGIDQKWIDVTKDRTESSVYTNGTKKPIQVSISVSGSGPGSEGSSAEFAIDGKTVAFVGEYAYLSQAVFNHVINPGSSYSVLNLKGVRINTWAEYR